MKTLDEQVPSGYFEALPNQTLARLEGSMQHGSSGTTETRDKVAPPPITASPVDQEVPTPMVKPIMDQDREEDSGLHDIRNLAQSTKQRLSKRSITSPPIPDDDVLAASSGSFKNIALPQPARMVSLPSMDELPSKAEIAAAEKAAKKAAKEAKDSQKAKPAEPVAASAPAVEVPAVAATVPARSAFTLPSQQRKSSKGPLLAVVGLGLAAAAGGVIFMQVNKKSDSASPSVASEAATQDNTAMTTPVAGAAGAAAAAPAVAAPDPAPAAPPPAEEAKAEAPPVEAQLATDDVKDAEDKADTKKRTAKPSKGGAKTKVEKEAPKVDEQKPVEKAEPKKPVATKGGEAEGEPSFDALLKEAGVSDQKKEAKPKLDKKSLTGDDFKKGMASVASKAKGCYKGTQGTAMVKLTVAPSGSISKLSVSGEFAGKPEGSCVESALKGASFPPWDGGPQSFTYSVLLSD